MTKITEEETEENKIPLIEHLRELRRRVVISALAFFIATILCYLLSGDIYRFLAAPLAESYGVENGRLIYTGLTEAFLTYIRLSIFAGFVISFPIIAWQAYAFIAPGLYKKEKKVILPFIMAAPVLFIMGSALAYYFIFPMAWKFFMSFQSAGGEGVMAIQLEARVSEYLSLATSLIIAFGLAFQMPLVLLLLAYAGFVTSSGMSKKRKYAIIGIFTLAAVITPPDIISQIGLALPMILLYECSIYGCKLIEKGKIENA